MEQIGDVSQQQDCQGSADDMHVRHVPTKANQLDHSRQEKVPRMSNHSKQNQLQISFLMMPPLSNNSNPVLHPATNPRTHPPVPTAHLWRMPLPKRMGCLLGANLQPCHRNPPRQPIDPSRPALAHPELSPHAKSHGRRHPLWHLKRVDSGHRGESKGYPRYLH